MRVRCALCLQELEEIETIWELTSEWETNWNGWKSCRFLDLKCREMEELSTDMYKKLFKMSRELKVRTQYVFLLSTILSIILFMILFYYTIL